METTNPVRRRRVDAGLSRNELASLVDLSVAGLGSIERCDSRPSAEGLEKLAGIFSIPAVALEVELEAHRQAIRAGAEQKLEAVGNV